jgi:2-hydroxychromene-2-carboxylate isomerase
MSNLIDLKIFFNFRSPYCYLASKTMFNLLDDYNVNLLWRPLGGWDGRSPPDRAKVKLPLARQDVARWARRMGIPCNPPPPTTDPTIAGLGSLLAEEKDCLQEYVIEVMRCEWAGSQDIGQREILIPIAESIGLDAKELEAVLDDPASQKKLDDNWKEAQSLGVIGVPSFVINDQIFWGNDRMDFLEEYLIELRLLNV